jgi:hypothetical protein
VTDPVADDLHAWADEIAGPGSTAYANALTAAALADIATQRASRSTLQAQVKTKTKTRDDVKAAAQTSEQTLAGYTGQNLPLTAVLTAGASTITGSFASAQAAAGGWIQATSVTLGTGLVITASTDKITATAHGLANGDLVTVTAVTGPTTLHAGASYYVVSATTNDFKLALTPGGSAIDIDANGTVTVTKPGLQAGTLVTDWETGTLTLSKPATSSGSFTVSVQTGSLAVQDATIAALTAQKAALTAELATISDGTAILDAITDGRAALVAAGHYLAPRTIARDGSTDQTSAIQTWLGTVPDGAGPFTPNYAHWWRSSTYRVDGTITLSGRNNLRWDHHGSTFTAGVTGSATRVHISVEGCTQTRIVRAKIRGSLPAGTPAFSSTYAGQHGIQVLDGANVVIDRPDIDGVYGSGIRIGRTTTDPNVVKIIGAGTVGRCGNHALGVAACDGLEWTTVAMGATGRDTIAVSPASGIVCDGVNLHDFRITGAVTDSAYFSIDGAGAGKINNLTIDGVTADAAHGPLIANIVAQTSGTPHTNVTITDNVGAGSYVSTSRAAWVLTNATNLIFTGNTQAFTQQSGQDVMYGLRGTTIGGTVTVSGNTLTHAVDEAIIDGSPKPGRSGTITITAPTSLGPFTQGVSLGAGIQFTAGHSAGGETWTHSTPAGGQALPTGVTFSSAGLLSGTPGSTTAGTYTHRFTVTDSLSQTTYVDLTFKVVADLAITTASLAFTVGTPSVATLAAVGGTTPYHWSLSTGTLPSGFTLDDDGDLHWDGTGTAGTPSRTFKVTDSAATPDTDTKAVTLNIAATAGAFKITAPTTLGPFAPGVSLGAGVSFASSGGTGTVTWTHSTPSGGDALPSGLTFSSAGVLAGTPAASTAGSYTHRFTATDSSGTPQSVFVDLTFKVKTDLTIVTTTLGPYVKGTDATDDLDASGGTGTKHWSTVGSLPAGFTLDDDGTLHVNGSSIVKGSTDVTFKVTDEFSPTPDTDTQKITLSVSTSSGTTWKPYITPVTRTWVGLSGAKGETVWADLLAKGVPLKIVRIPAEGATVNPAKGQWDWTGVDNRVSKALGLGLEVNLMPTYFPKWLVGSNSHAVPGDATFAQVVAWWSEFLGRIANRYCRGGSDNPSFIKTGAYVTHIEQQNEPNMDVYFHVTDGGAVMDHYADLVAAGYDAAKDVTGWCTVGCGASGVHTINDSFGAALTKMLARWKATGYKQHARGWTDKPVDALYAHPYCGGRLGSTGQNMPYLDCKNNATYNSFANWVPIMANVAKAAGLGVCRIHGTEFGGGHMPDATTSYGRHGNNPKGPAGGAGDSNTGAVGSNGGDPERKIASEPEMYRHTRNGYRAWGGLDAWPTGSNLTPFDGDPDDQLGALHFFAGIDIDTTDNNGVPTFDWDNHYGLYSDSTPPVPKRLSGSANDAWDALIELA